jgi:hypothetical protein
MRAAKSVFENGCFWVKEEDYFCLSRKGPTRLLLGNRGGTWCGERV